MDSGNTPEIKEEAVQPDETVVVDSEAAKAIPQAEDTEPTELYIEEEADQEQAKQGMSQAQSYAAFQKEKQKRKNKQIEIDEGKTERAEMQATIDKLQETVGQITKGKPPSLDDYYNDEDGYQVAMKEFYSTPAPATKEVAKPQAQNNVRNDEAEFNLYQQEQALIKDLPDYEEAKASFMNTVKTKYGATDPSVTVAWIADIAKQANVDAAKAIFAMNKLPSLIDELNSAGNNQFAVAEVLKKAASKVKSRVKVPITTQPEPEINNTGPIDNSSATVAKLYKAWKENSSLANHQRYIKAKNSNKVNENG